MTKYVCKDYESVYQDYLDTAQQDIEDRVRRLENGVAKYQVKETYAGDILEIDVYPIWKGRRTAQQERIRSQDAQARYNRKRSRKRIERLLNANFGSEDCWYTFNYDDEHLPTSNEQAQRNIRNYVRRLQYRCRKQGLPDIKAVYSTEYSDDPIKGIRVHHHLVVNFSDRDVAENMWQFGGRNQARRLRPDKNGLTGLADYVAKPVDNEKGVKRTHVKSWCATKNLSKPDTRVYNNKMSRKKARTMVCDKDYAVAWLESQYPQYDYIGDEYSLKVLHNELCDGYYIQARMCRRN